MALDAQVCWLATMTEPGGDYVGDRPNRTYRFNATRFMPRRMPFFVAMCAAS